MQPALTTGPTDAAPTTTDAAPPAPESPPAKPAPVTMTSVDDARARIFRARKRHFELAVVDGAEYAFVYPPEGVRGEIGKLTLEAGANGRLAPGNMKKKEALTVVSMVHTIVVDGTSKMIGTPIFGQQHLEMLLKDDGVPSILSLFYPACERVLDAADKEAEEAAKND